MMASKVKAPAAKKEPLPPPLSLELKLRRVTAMVPM